MTAHRPRKIVPKISTLPRQQSEASQHLERYKLAVEKARLQQELQALTIRQQQIKDRLGVLNQQLDPAGPSPQPESASQPTTRVYRPERPQPSPPFSTVTLDY